MPPPTPFHQGEPPRISKSIGEGTCVHPQRANLYSMPGDICQIVHCFRLSARNLTQLVRCLGRRKVLGLMVTVGCDLVFCSCSRISPRIQDDLQRAFKHLIVLEEPLVITTKGFDYIYCFLLNHRVGRPRMQLLRFVAIPLA